MPRVLLIVPTATYRAPEFLAAARRLRLEVVTASEEPQALAGSMGDRFLELPLQDPPAAAERIVELAHRRGLDAVVAIDDGGSLAAAIAAERLGLVANPPDAIAATRDKAEMRRRLERAGVDQPRFAVSGRGTDEVAARADELGYPVVVKPVSLSGSRGVIRCDDERGARAATARIAAILARVGAREDEPLLVESYVPGDEYAIEGLARRGRLEVLAIFDKPDPLEGPYFEETIYVTPTDLPPDAKARAGALVESAAAALGIVEGPVHAEVRRRADGSLVLIELAARTIGGKCSSALRFATGASLEDLVLAHALGRATPLTASLSAGASGVMMIPIPATGRLAGADLAAARAVESITGAELNVPLGSPIEALPEGDRYLGFLFARAPESGAVTAALREANARLAVRVAVTDRDGR